MLRFQRNIQILTGREKAETVNDILENDSMGENCSKFYMYSGTGQMSRVSSNGWKFTKYNCFMCVGFPGAFLKSLSIPDV